MERYTIKEKLGLTAAGSMMVSAFALAWGIPGDWLYGWNVWAIFGLLCGMTAVLFGAVVVTAAVCGIVREVLAERRCRDSEDHVQLIGREWRYVSRETVCRASGGRK